MFVRSVFRLIGRILRVQWFVTNVAVVPMPGWDAVPPPGVSVRPGSPEDAPALAPLIRGRESLAWRFARGDIVLVAEVEHQVVGCTWLTSQPMRPSYFPIAVRPKPGDWYNYGLVLLPQHRVQGIGRTLSRIAMKEAWKRGGTRVFGHALRWDRMAAASHVAAGFVTVEELIGITFFQRLAVVLYRRPRTSSP